MGFIYNNRTPPIKTYPTPYRSLSISQTSSKMNFKKYLFLFLTIILASLVNSESSDVHGKDLDTVLKEIEKLDFNVVLSVNRDYTDVLKKTSLRRRLSNSSSMTFDDDGDSPLKSISINIKKISIILISIFFSILGLICVAGVCCYIYNNNKKKRSSYINMDGTMIETRVVEGITIF